MDYGRLRSFLIKHQCIMGLGIDGSGDKDSSFKVWGLGLRVLIAGSN